MGKTLNLTYLRFSCCIANLKIFPHDICRPSVTRCVDYFWPFYHLQLWLKMYMLWLFLWVLWFLSLLVVWGLRPLIDWTGCWLIGQRPTYAMIGSEKSETGSPWRVKVKRLTKICWCLFAPFTKRLLRQRSFAKSGHTVCSQRTFMYFATLLGSFNCKLAAGPIKILQHTFFTMLIL